MTMQINTKINERLLQIEKTWVHINRLPYVIREFVYTQPWYKSHKWYKFRRKQRVTGYTKRMTTFWRVYMKGVKEAVAELQAPDEIESITDMLRRIIAEYGDDPDIIKDELAAMEMTDEKRKKKRERYLKWKAKHKKREEAGVYDGLNK